MNINCVICSDPFVPVDSIFTTPCGHIFHHACLIQWLERSKTCPQCRNKCTERNILRIFVNTNANLDSTQNTENLTEIVDNLTLQIREKNLALKSAEEERLKLESTLKSKEKKIERLDDSVSRNTQVIATMRHEMDILASHRAKTKTLETENAELKSKLDLMLSIESVLTASQSEVDEILKQQMSARDLSVMVGTLRRELNNNEIRKNQLRKQIQVLKNDFRKSDEERRQLQDKFSSLESEHNSLKNRLRRYEDIEADSSLIESPECVKRPRLALKLSNELNTPSPLTKDEFNNRVAKVQTSDSPYLQVKASSIALASALQKPMLMRTVHQTKSKLMKSKSSDGLSQLSIFKRPRAELIASSSAKSENLVYNGVGGSSKLFDDESIFCSLPSKPNCLIKRKKLSPSALKK